MKRPEIMFDSNFIADRYFSYKSHQFQGMDIYRDKGKVFPLLAPVKQNMETAKDPRFNKPPSILPHISPRSKKAAYQPAFLSSFPKRVKKYKYKGLVKENPISEEEAALQQMYFLMLQEYPEEIEGQIVDEGEHHDVENKGEKEGENNSSAAQGKPEEPNSAAKKEEDDEEEDIENEEEYEESEDSPKKKRKNKRKKKKNEEDLEREDGDILWDIQQQPAIEEKEEPKRKKLTARDLVNRHKEAIRMLETPSDIYIRVAENINMRNKSALEQSKAKQKLESIMKKIDVKVQVGSQASILDFKTNKALDQMKRVPLQYFQKLRTAKSRSRARNVSADMGTEEAQNCSQIFFNFDSQKNIELPRDVTLANISTTLAEDVFTEENPLPNQTKRPSIINRLRKSIDKKEASAWDLVKCEEDPFFSPLNKYLNSSMVASTKAPNSTNRMKGNDSFNQSFLLRTPNMTSNVYKSGRSRSEIVAAQNRTWLSSKVSQLGFEINDLHNKTTVDIGHVKNCRKVLAEDVKKIGTKKLDFESKWGDEEETDQHHYEDALQSFKEKLQKENASIMAYAKGLLKNKRERNTENVKFEKHLTKIEKKIVERSKVKTSQINSKRPTSSKINVNPSIIKN